MIDRWRGWFTAAGATEAAVVVACLVANYLVLRLVAGRRDATTSSLWLGRAVIDGVLFPLFGLAAVYAAGLALGMLPRGAGVMRVALPLLASLAAIRFVAKVLALAFPASTAARQAERLFSWLAWGAAGLWITGVLAPMLAELDSMQIPLGKSRVSLLEVLNGVLLSGLVLVGVLWISALIEQRLLRDSVSDLSRRKIAANALRGVLLLLGLLLVLTAIGVDLTALSVLGGALGVGLGLGLQKLAANYVSGFVILAERSVRIGDLVRVDGFEGRVEDIKTRYTLIRALNGVESIVPNEKLVSERIENLSLADPRILLTVSVSVAYSSDTDQVVALLESCVRDTPRVLADPPPSARLLQLGADGLEFAVYFWIDDPQNGRQNVCSDVNLRILKALNAAGIEIPFAQRVLHVHNMTSFPAASAPPASPAPFTSSTKATTN